MSFKDEVVIITGGAAGIGLAAARAFAGVGAHVLITGRRASRLAEISEIEGRIEHLVADVAVPTDAQRTIARAVELWGRVDVLVNNAGAGLLMPLTETTAEHANAVYAANTVGPTLLAAAAVPHLIESRGSIINMSSSWRRSRWLASRITAQAKPPLNNSPDVGRWNLRHSASG